MKVEQVPAEQKKGKEFAQDRVDGEDFMEEAESACSWEEPDVKFLNPSIP